MLTITPEGRRWLPWIVFGGIVAVLLGRELASNVEAPISAPRDSITLLRAGDPKVCAASDVAQTVRDMIRPKSSDTSRYRISLTAAVLEAFDQSVTKATCRANVEIRRGDGVTLSSTPLSYAVQPSADDTNKFVVWASSTELQQQLSERVAADEAVEQDRQQQDATYRQLRSTVTPQWLRGRWVFAEAGSAACASDDAFDFKARGRLLYQGQLLGWKLNETTLSFTGSAATTNNLFLSATADSFTLQDADLNEQSFRRCAAYELPAEAPSPAVAPTQEPRTQPEYRERSSFEDPS